MRPKKQPSQKAVRTTISMPMFLLVAAQEQQQRRGHMDFSSYIQSLVFRDRPNPPQPVQEAA